MLCAVWSQNLTVFKWNGYFLISLLDTHSYSGLRVHYLKFSIIQFGVQ